jgi:hypothetical protein
MLSPLPASKWNFTTAAHLLNRAGFGGSPAEIEALEKMGPESAVDHLVDYEKLPDETPDPAWAKPAAEFSFFLAMPTMTAAFVLDFVDVKDSITTDRAAEIVVGFVFAFLSSLLVVKPFLAFVTRVGFMPFAGYRILAGAAVLAAVRMKPERGPASVLCVVEVTKSQCSTGFGCKPAATRPAKCAMSQSRSAPTSSAISRNFAVSTVRG